jgi:hypothetical protein
MLERQDTKYLFIRASELTDTVHALGSRDKSLVVRFVMIVFVRTSLTRALPSSFRHFPYQR